MDAPAFLLKLIPLLPLAGAIATAVLGPWLLKRYSHVPVILGLVGSLLCSLMLLAATQVQAHRLGSPAGGQVGYEPEVVTLWTWVEIPSAELLPPPAENLAPTEPDAANPPAAAKAAVRPLAIRIDLRADTLSSMMLVMVTFISLLVAVYSTGYMQGDRGYWRFFSYLGLFVFSMTMLVSVSNFLLLFVFWEAVGACSYLLIGFWYEKPAAAAAGKKAFLVNRIGDFGFALGVFLIWTHFGTLNFHDTQSGGERMPGVLGQTRLQDVHHQYPTGGTATAICLLLFLGACGKSAQFPLHVWLPDAMEGPTPVSALIHAATMVTAGVYLVARCLPLFQASPDAQLVVSCVGGFTAILAALIALTQFDLKRVLAYSTISQLGFMFLALGAGTLDGATAGMFHLFTHAFFKALLFLAAGSVMHAMGGVIDMRRFGGLRSVMPITCLTFLLGALALAGVPPFAGFWSKDAVLESISERVEHLDHELALDGHPAAGEPAGAAHGLRAGVSLATQRCAYRTLYYLALFTAGLTAFYTFRAFFLTFFGPLRIPREAGHHAHESPATMSIPLLILAVCAAVAGFVGPSFFEFLRFSPSLAWADHPGPPQSFPWQIAAISTLVGLMGIGGATYLYLGSDREVRGLADFMQLGWLARLADLEWLGRVREQRIVALVERGARRIGLGAVCTIVGVIVQLTATLLMLPALVARFCSPYRLSQEKFYFDELYQGVLVWPVSVAANVCYWIDQYVVDGLVNLCGAIPPAVGGLFRWTQIGLVQFYALAMVLGGLIVVVCRFFWLAA